MPTGIAVPPNGSRAHVANNAVGSVNVIATAASRVAFTPERSLLLGERPTTGTIHVPSAYTYLTAPTA
ncbi:hypothetical protein [Kitasatospora sp. NPDC058190]|uniref:hypothetical protein n=1 Tax=Kitasatospora sp. NPDC058190 TaxID=3346371 RepID=UPI0036DEAB1F